MTTQLRIDMFDAGPGDAFVVSADRDGRRTVIVIDGGPPGTPGRGMLSHLTRLGGGIRASVDLLAVTHLDNDHIGGAIDLAEHALTPTAGAPLLDIAAAWHNSFDELVGPAYSRHGGNFSTKVSSLLRGWSARPREMVWP